MNMDKMLRWVCITAMVIAAFVCVTVESVHDIAYKTAALRGHPVKVEITKYTGYNSAGLDTITTEYYK